ncbi:hypothetical protein [Pseudomonas phage vB_PaeP_C2-10_Ab09]|uniref:Uncharacterized protein n=1 Tax=Pseudomonas phage vB_PaeP_C2-10_Ab09 TaxID=1476391 RepID=X5KIJ0_9CAUD|nr:hypothetical protein FG40_gp04 [Pseudomonas phage vB_PaeP_C2-10_Ab09]CDN96817.1 hypothetical protein [Pseudomonas phage vB_PaeP_C2-10_Ab09]
MNTLYHKMQEHVCFVGFTRAGMDHLSNRVHTFGEARHFITFNCRPVTRTSASSTAFPMKGQRMWK